ncbi:NAD-dependent deacylase [Cohnella sp. GbtcB17]|uniref:SIR2 family NAD-dependent protein deacylase n=1 Tax=Cohnella sp. GbtcB17 TaxID=2824762 RepID=UPI0020C67389|nr:NAD-dependent deacylase [Cohnella sp. GbtcB17]
MRSGIDEAARFVKGASKAVVLTGAGMSTEAGIPDFRSKAGWWNQVDPMTLATPDAVELNYDQFHAFYADRVRRLEGIVPTPGHVILANWELAGRVALTATQNVDGLHQAAGSRNVKELHGSIAGFCCHLCRARADRTSFLCRENCSCGGPLRPEVVLFGESLPQLAWDSTVQAIEEADLVIVIGTSLQVYPVNSLPSLTDGHLILINAEPTGQESAFDVFIQGKAGASLRAIDDLL